MKWFLPMHTILPKPEESDRVWLVRDDHIGDLVYTTSASIKWLTDHQHDVYLILRKEFLSIGKLLLPEHKLIPLDYKAYRTSLRYRWQFMKTIRRLGFKLAIGSVTHSSVNSDIVRNSGATAKYGYQITSSLRERFRLRGLTLVKSLSLMGNGRYRSVLEHEKTLISRAVSSEISHFHSFIHPMRKQELPPCIVAQKYIAYVADSTNQKRNYPPRLLPLLEDISFRFNMHIVMMAVKYIKTENHKNLINLTGKTTLENALNIIANASLVIGNETGPVHIASLWSVPTIMFYGGGHFGRLRPEKAALASCPMPCYCCNWNCTHPDKDKTLAYPCIEGIDEKKLQIMLHDFMEKKVIRQERHHELNGF